ncbi:diguanylate cyclase (GGDEF)-like protein [Duganella sp. SG902]|uniref:sensor domain-containing diguanylate cyclase n=1 Tax=Duganella sp. SG902 TaxID=2587016 RepID=UPI00159E5BA2|nr:sensor domain-containing diguanylate cyclase [Duganella sp. SG902]NVM75127.1 diguanylate cyclase (GGDEF)-like protein [Duganella sp. SG902]
MFKRFSITFWATVFVSVVCLSLVVIDVWRSVNARSSQLQEMERLGTNVARAMAQQADDTIKAADTALADLVERIETDGQDARALARLQKQMAAQVANLPQLIGLFVYDEQGRWIVNSRGLLSQAYNNADREYFIHHRTHPERTPHVGEPVISRSTGKWIMPVSRRLNKPDGSFGGVVLATLDIEYFRRFYQSFDVGTRGALALVGNNGVLMLRKPFDAERVGSSMRDSELYRHYARMGGDLRAGSAFFQSFHDGETRLHNFRSLEHYPLFVTAGISREEMLERWRRDTFARSVGVAVLAALIGFFGKRLVGQIKLRGQAEAELRKARDALESANRTLERQAMQDGLTGLANRRQFDVTLGNEFSRATRHADTLAFIMIDVDYFKQYNDVYGHSAGDEVLRAVSKLIRALTPRRPGDLSARYGGEEIGILLPNTEINGAQAVAERIREAVEHLRLPHNGSPLGHVTLSAGVATISPQRGVHLASMLVEAADKALYVAKSEGRNRVSLATS